jgi:phosphatidylglycerophosphate synthase
MFDPLLRRVVDPPLNAAGRAVASWGVSANAVTLLGLVVGLAGAAAIAQNAYGWGLAGLLANRVLDGLDGAVARVRGKTAYGAYLDSVCDFVFYAAVPLAFGVSSPERLLPALVLTASFLVSGASFLAFAAVAPAEGEKGFTYLAGLAEGGETILVFVLMALVPEWFAPLAYGFAALCLLTALARLVVARKRL